MMRKIAITGVIASGKSQVCKIIEQLGGKVIYTDKINNSLLQNKDYIEKLSKIFPSCVDNYKVDRRAIRNVISTNCGKRKELNDLAHGEIKKQIKELINAYQGEVVFCEIPLLIEANMVDFFDDIWCVNADYNIKLQRLMLRDNIDLTTAENMIKCQSNDEKLLQIATTIINNNGTIEELYGKVKQCYDAIK